MSATPGTNIVGVWLPNNVEQEIAGVPQGCRFPADVNDAEWGGGEVRRIFGRDPASLARLFDTFGSLQYR